MTTIQSYKEGKKKFSHCEAGSENEVVFYFDVNMPVEDIDKFALTLGIKSRVSVFYACVAVSDKSKPRTYIAYKTTKNVTVELFGISTGIQPATILKNGFVEV